MVALDPLKTEIQNDPLALGYAAHLPHDGQKVCDLLNAKTQTSIQPRMITARTIFDQFPDTEAASILDRLDEAAKVASNVKWAMSFLRSDAGMDIGSANAIKGLASLVQANVLTADESQALADMALQPCSRADVLGLGYVTYEMLSNSLWNDDGSPK